MKTAMRKFKEKLCMIFNHKYKYFVLSMNTPNLQLRYCKRCGRLEIYKSNQVIPAGWSKLTERTDYGAKQFLQNCGLKNINN
jgi:peroxiredoxin